MTEAPDTVGTESALGARVAAQAREIADTINAGPVEQREGLRDEVVSILRDEVRADDPAPQRREAAAAGTFNPFGIGIPLVLMGAVMVFLFPPVGLLLFAVAGIVVAWGVATTVFAHR